MLPASCRSQRPAPAERAGEEKQVCEKAGQREHGPGDPGFSNLTCTGISGLLIKMEFPIQQVWVGPEILHSRQGPRTVDAVGTRTGKKTKTHQARRTSRVEVRLLAEGCSGLQSSWVEGQRIFSESWSELELMAHDFVSDM